MAWHGMAMAWLKTKAKIKIHVKIAKMENCQKSIIQIKKKDFLWDFRFQKGEKPFSCDDL
jgi:hypothetical protein